MTVYLDNYSKALIVSMAHAGLTPLEISRDWPTGWRPPSSLAIEKVLADYRDHGMRGLLMTIPVELKRKAAR